MARKHLLEKLKNLKSDIERIERTLVSKPKIEEFDRLLAETKDVLGKKVDLIEIEVSDKAEMLAKIGELAELLEKEVV